RGYGNEWYRLRQFGLGNRPSLVLQASMEAENDSCSAGLGLLFLPLPRENEVGQKGRAMQETILQSVGRTPLVQLRRLGEGLQAKVYVKVEAMNPGGSVKDRVGLAMISEAERRGWLRPGGTVIEATAGNTGVGLAMAAAVKGYRCIFVMPDKMSSEKILLL